MAVTTTTYTATLQSYPMQANATGINFAGARARITTSSTSAVCRVYLAKIPHGAVVIDGYVTWANDNSTANAAPGTLNLGIAEAGSDKTLTVSLITAASVSATAFARLAPTSTVMPYKVSVSSDATNQFKWVMATTVRVTHTGNASLEIDLVLMYTMDSSVHPDNLKNVT